MSYKPISGDGRWLCLDAKYRVSRKNLGDAFSSVHIYKDSLRYDGYGGKSKAVLLLSPSMTEDAAGWFSDEYIEAFGAGVREFKPGITSSQLGKWIVATLGVVGVACNCIAEGD